MLVDLEGVDRLTAVRVFLCMHFEENAFQESDQSLVDFCSRTWISNNFNNAADRDG
jgi:hypothetical protein